MCSYIVHPQLAPSVAQAPWIGLAQALAIDCVPSVARHSRLLLELVPPVTVAAAIMDQAPSLEPAATAA